MGSVLVLTDYFLCWDSTVQQVLAEVSGSPESRTHPQAKRFISDGRLVNVPPTSAGWIQPRIRSAYLFRVQRIHLHRH